MDRALTALIPVPEPGPPDHPDVLGWGCPVPFFGHLESARLATVGINPSNREFAGTDGAELAGASRRLPTLGSLGLSSWSQADHDVRHIVTRACCEYFERNPYRRWFGILQQLIEPTGTSYYPPRSNACHLDIVPWATTRKWGTLPPATRLALVAWAAQTMAAVIASAPIAMLVLNGNEVVRQFEILAGRQLDAFEVTGWNLARRNGRPVAGVAYVGVISAVGGIDLSREIIVTGYNHNLQSSFGVSAAVRHAISEWIAAQYRTTATPGISGSLSRAALTRPAVR
jgi:hypothetical protein